MHAYQAISSMGIYILFFKFCSTTFLKKKFYEYHLDSILFSSRGTSYFATFAIFVSHKFSWT